MYNVALNTKKNPNASRQSGFKINWLEQNQGLVSQNNLLAVVTPDGVFGLYKRSLIGYMNLRGVDPTAFAGAVNEGMPVLLQSEKASG